MVLYTSQVLFFFKAIDLRDMEKVGLNENDHGIIMDWVAITRVCNYFNKQREWYYIGIGTSTNEAHTHEKCGGKTSWRVRDRQACYGSLDSPN